MSRTFAPDYGALSTLQGYRPMHTWFLEVKPCLTPFPDGPRYYPTYTQAKNAAKEWVAEKMAKQVRSEKTEVTADTLGVAAWHEQRAAKAANDQEAVLGAIVVKGRQVRVERRQRRSA